MHQRTLAEENYLKTIYHLSGPGREAVSTNGIAREMATTAASVTDMVKRLASKNMVNYRKYRGVTLTPEGRKIASWVIRSHRLWECFLVEKLGFPWDEVHDLAEQLEHVGNNDLTEKLGKYLGNPKYDPHGDPIPTIKGKIVPRSVHTLNEQKVGSAYEVVGVKNSSPVFLKYLDSAGIKLGTRIRLIRRISFDGSVVVRAAGKENILLSEKGGSNILVKKLKQ